MEKQRAIGVLTSGGDAPGMNAAIRAVVRTAIYKGMKVYGIRRGYSGLIKGEYTEMQCTTVCDIIQRGGTVLYTARCPEFATPEGVQKGVDMCKNLNIEGLVVIGGDGSFRGARDLSIAGIPTVGIPGTIDNDISSSQYSIGFDTAINTVVQSVDKIRDTSQSHARCSVVEVMGHGAGDIAIYAGIACGALTIIVPERTFDFQKDIIDKMYATTKTGKNHFIIVVSEQCVDTAELTQRIEKETGITSRLTVLGHVQRGGSPTARERVIASQFGYHAVELLDRGVGNRVIGYKDGQVVDYDILEGLSMKKPFDQQLYDMANVISL